MDAPLQEPDSYPLIKVVGISASGKSTLVHALRQLGYRARPVSQEHSNVPHLWAQFDRPAVLIYLHADIAAQRQRRPHLDWTPNAHAEEEARLANARDHADLRIDTSTLTPGEVLEIALALLKHRRVAHAPHPLPDLPRTGGSIRPGTPRNTQ